jgi:hypothetical protein
MQPLEQTTRPRGAGGTPGGIGEFLLGLGMAVAGGYWLTSSVTVSSGYWRFWGHNAFGLSLVPLVLGDKGANIMRQVHMAKDLMEAHIIKGLLEAQGMAARPSCSSNRRWHKAATRVRVFAEHLEASFMNFGIRVALAAYLIQMRFGKPRRRESPSRRDESGGLLPEYCQPARRS